MVRRRGLMGFLMKRGGASFSGFPLSPAEFCSGADICFSDFCSGDSVLAAGAVEEGSSRVSGATVFCGSGGAGASSFSGAAAVPSAEEIWPRTAPIGASAPSGTRISSTPLSSASRSVETLSVSSVTRVSPLATGSPAFLCHAATVAVVMDSPKLGIRMSLMGGRWVQDCARGPKAVAMSLFCAAACRALAPSAGQAMGGRPA